VPLPATPAGSVIGERQQDEVYTAEYEAARPAFVLFRMTWHQNWRARVDGVVKPTMMLSPGFAGVRTEAGRHRVEWRYEPGTEKFWLALAGLLAVVTLALGERWRRVGRTAPPRPQAKGEASS
jgi:hypothetical protein